MNYPLHLFVKINFPEVKMEGISKTNCSDVVNCVVIGLPPGM